MKDTVSIRSPFKFLDPYDKEDRSIFFGREKEIEALYEHTFLSKLMLVYGASGTGKTSLVNCGLRNRFTATDWLAVEVRRGNHIVDSLFQELRKRSQQGLNADETRRELSRTLPIEQIVAELYQEFFIPVYLLFDQFEELFIQGEKEEQQAFFQTLQRLLESDVPCKIILILREEYLAYLSDFEILVPALFDNRFRIEPMNQRQLEEVVHKTATAPQFGIVFENPEENTQRILHNLRDERNEVELTNLQVYLDRLYKSDITRRREEGADRPITFDAPLIEKLGQLPEVLSVFLDEQLASLDQELNLPGLGLDILAGFVTNDGTKRHRSEPEAAESLQARRRISREEASRLTALALEGLVEGRLLRPIRLQEEVRYELSHDLLAGQVFERFSAEEKALRKAERLLQSNYELHQDIRRQDSNTSKYLTEQELALIAPYLPAIEGGKGLHAYFEESREHIRQLRDAERLKKEQELKEAQRQAEEERKLKERAQGRTRLAVIVSLLALLLAVFAGWSYLQADKARKQADEAKEAADLSAKVAEEKGREALAEKAKAEEERIKADSSAQVALAKSEEARKATIRAEDNLKRAKAQEARATAALDQVKKEQAATEEQRKRAEENASLAQEATKQAEEQRDKAQAALDELEASNAEVARLILQNADKDILKLDYLAALAKIKAAASLGTLKEEVAKSYLELAFWFGESGQAQRAVGILDSAAQLVNNKAVPELLQALPQDTAAAREKIKEAIKLLDKGAFDTLWERYYPVMVEVKGGTFLMGSSKYDYEKPHTASVSTFLIAKHETTWWQYALFCQATGRQYERPGWGTDGDNPVVYVSWYDAVEYANWVNGQLGFEEAVKKDGGNYSVNLKSNGFRLPTEAEWEYAARGGSQKSPYTYAGSDEVGVVAWYNENSESRTQPVGKKKPNALGIHDMSGNVWEWCWDRGDEYLDNPPLDYKGPPSGSGRVLRGGSWLNDQGDARCAYRGNAPGRRDLLIGFRLARTGGQ